ncbi:EcsC family protein [Nocardioides panacisoli]|uniref:EcsC family protein n=1 Tax=Nocardioides panacisoli TaxID=627624 RepID=UPI001C626BB2|nr:EcsC family protein [Nocardioides panacisoli]QYJ03466.1 EcsC family protein [Nocardioides panacisoli]
MPNFKRGLVTQAALQVVPKVTAAAPQVTSAVIRQALDRAIAGVGPLPPAAAAADEQLREQHGDVDKGIHEVIENHVRYALAEGFVTNLGGLVTATVLAPTNIAGLALIQCRMVAGIVHLRGYDLADARVRTAILATLLGEDTVRKQVKRGRLSAPPAALADAAEPLADLDPDVAQAVANEMVNRVVGKRMALTVGKRTPLVGGVLGAGTDGYSTWRIGRYADREFTPRSRRA